MTHVRVSYCTRTVFFLQTQHTGFLRQHLQHLHHVMNKIKFYTTHHHDIINGYHFTFLHHNRFFHFLHTVYQMVLKYYLLLQIPPRKHYLQHLHTLYGYDGIRDFYTIFSSFTPNMNYWHVDFTVRMIYIITVVTTSQQTSLQLMIISIHGFQQTHTNMTHELRKAQHMGGRV